MQQFAKERCLLKRNTAPEVFPLRIGSGKTKPFEKRHAGCEERKKINRRRIYDTLRINFLKRRSRRRVYFQKERRRALITTARATLTRSIVDG